jgi:hypothetical protein
VLHRILIDEFLNLADQSEIERGSAESGAEPDERTRFRQQPGNLPGARPRFLDEDPFYVMLARARIVVLRQLMSVT